MSGFCVSMKSAFFLKAILQFHVMMFMYGDLHTGCCTEGIDRKAMKARRRRSKWSYTFVGLINAAVTVPQRMYDINSTIFLIVWVEPLKSDQEEWKHNQQPDAKSIACAMSDTRFSFASLSEYKREQSRHDEPCPGNINLP